MAPAHASSSFVGSVNTLCSLALVGLLPKMLHIIPEQLTVGAVWPDCAPHPVCYDGMTGYLQAGRPEHKPGTVEASCQGAHIEHQACDEKVVITGSR